jgi:pantoate--beta-alanine ligase
VTATGQVVGSVRDVGAAPLLVRDRAGLAAARDAMPGRVAVVMTMGALHEGHLSLVRLARAEADHVVVTVFVNPLQFGPGEDLDAYPRTLDADLAVCAQEGVDVVFAPTASEVYPAGEPSVRVHAGDVATRWEGASRPGHFDGVLTVVAVLLHLVRPHVAVFGRKDRQQLTLVQAMVRDLAMAVQVLPGDTVREADGLAMSSRNAYLDPAQRTRAVALSQALRAADRAAEAGQDAPRVAAAAREVLASTPGVEPDYCALVDPDRLVEVGADHTGPAVVLVAARVGSTRLIDNADVVVRGPGA